MRSWVEDGKIPAPSFVLGKWSYYTEDEVTKIVAYAQQKKDKKRGGRASKITAEGVADIRRRWFRSDHDEQQLAHQHRELVRRRIVAVHAQVFLGELVLDRHLLHEV